MSEQQKVIGGDLARALKGDFQLSLGDTIKQGFAVTQKHWAPLCLAFIGLIAINILVFLVITSNFVSLEQIQQSAQTQLLMNLLQTAISAPFLGGIALMGIRHSIGLGSKATDMFDGFSQLLPLVSVSLLSSAIAVVVNQLALLFHPALTILSSLYITSCFMLAVPLVAERKMGPLSALYASFVIAHKALPQFVLITLCLGVLLIIAALPLFLGLIWMLPMTYNVIGVLYRDVVGVQVTTDDSAQPTNRNEDNWSA